MQKALARFLGEMRNASDYKSWPRQIFELIQHKLKINTSFADYYRFGFYRDSLSWEEKSLYLGPNGSRYWPFEGNSLKYDRLFVVKSIQKALLIGFGLPTSRMLFKVGADYPINTLEKFRNALLEVRCGIVTKFAGGGSGINVYVLDHDGDGFAMGGQKVDADWIWQQYESSLDKGFFVEEQLRNHSALAALHPQSLNTVRLNMIRTADGKWHIVKPFLKIGREASRVDNMSAGGLFAGISEDGTVGVAYQEHSTDEFEFHPNTGARIAGLRLPYFDDARRLALEAARTLGFMATFGWDVAITPEGPVLIEANPFWLFESLQEHFGPLLTPEIAAGLVPRSWWTPWDRTHMYPGYFRHYAGGPWQRLLAARRQRCSVRLRDAARRKENRN